MAKANVVIEIGEKNIKIIEGVLEKDRILIKNYAIVKTPSATNQNGSIIDSKAIADLIYEELRARNIKTKETIIVVSGDVAINREITISKVTDKELANVVPFEAAQYFPVDLTGYKLDYKVLEEITAEDGKKYLKIYVSAIQFDIIRQYVNVAETAGLSLKVLDVATNCICKLVNMENTVTLKDKNEVIAVLDIGSAISRLVILQGNKVRFEKVINVGTGKMVDLLAQSNGIDVEKADEMLNEVFEQYMTNKNENVISVENRIYKLMNNNLCGSLMRLFEFYLSRNEGSAITRVILTGGGVNVPGIEKAIYQYIGIQGETLKGLKCVVDKTGTFGEAELQMSNVLGGLIRG